MSSAFEGLPKTPNLSLNKPGYDNVADIEALNENADILDEEISTIKSNLKNKGSATEPIYFDGNGVPQKTKNFNDYLPLAGGLMTDTVIGRSVNNSQLVFRGGTNADGGAALMVCGKDYNNGRFLVRANNGSAKNDLIGTADGTLMWNNKNIVRSVNGNTADSNGNVEIDSGIPVGFEYFSTNPNIPAGSIPLLGGEYSRTTYADLWEWVQTQNGYLLTESEWQAKASANEGNVPFYSSGDGSTTFRVPSLKCWIKGANGIEEVGSYLSAGLPNIEGNFDVNLQSGGYRLEVSTSGAFYNWIDERGRRTTDAGATTKHQNSSAFPGFDASRSNPIYGNSDTVQPKSIVGMWLVKAYGTVSNVGSTDVSAIAQGLTELETRQGDYVNKTLASDKELVVGWGMPDYSAGIDISNGFVCPCDGMILAHLTGTNATAIYLGDSHLVESKRLAHLDVKNASNAVVLSNCIVRKGDCVKYYLYNSNSSIKGTFFPFVGVNN